MCDLGGFGSELSAAAVVASFSHACRNEVSR